MVPQSKPLSQVRSSFLAFIPPPQDTNPSLRSPWEEWLFCFSQSFPSFKVHFRPVSSIKSSLTALPSSLFLLWPPTTQWYVIIIAFIGPVVDKALYSLVIFVASEVGKENFLVPSERKLNYPKAVLQMAKLGCQPRTWKSIAFLLQSFISILHFYMSTAPSAELRKIRHSNNYL